MNILNYLSTLNIFKNIKIRMQLIAELTIIIWKLFLNSRIEFDISINNEIADTPKSDIPITK